MPHAWLLHSIFLGGLLAGPMLAMAASGRPPANMSIDEIRTVRLQQKIALPCIALIRGEVRLQIATAQMNIVKATAQSGNPGGKASSTLQAKRAAAIRANRTGLSDSDGCQMLRNDVPDDALYLILESIEEGVVAVRMARSGALIDAVDVRYYGTDCGPMCGHGNITVSLRGSGRPFLDLPWWDR